MPKKVRGSKKLDRLEIEREIAKRTTDKEIQGIALGIALGGEDIDIAIKAATEEVQSLTRTVNAKEVLEKNRNRKRVKVEFIKGIAKGRRTEYWEDIAQKLEARGEVKILGYLKDSEREL